MKIATWNVNSLKVRLPQVLDYFDSAQLDVLCLQETKLTDEAFPLEAFTERGWYSVFCGQKTYNGVAMISRTPITDVVFNLPTYADEQKRVITATIDGVRIVNAYVVNGQAPNTEKFAYKMAWLEGLKAHMAQTLAAHEAVVLLGDFNIAPADEDVHNPAQWLGCNLVSPEERAAFADLINLGLVDVFRRFEQPEKSYSWWDYRQMGFRRNAGLRIDMILANSGLAAQCRQCEIDKQPRRHEQPSDHAPVWANIAWEGDNEPTTMAN